jgi:hypothetical protein
MHLVGYLYKDNRDARSLEHKVFFIILVLTVFEMLSPYIFRNSIRMFCKRPWFSEHKVIYFTPSSVFLCSSKFLLLMCLFPALLFDIFLLL